VITIWPTHLDEFTSCPALFELNKVMKLPREPNPYLAFGIAVDEAINANMESMRDRGAPIGESEYVTVFESNWVAQTEGIAIPWEKHDMDPSRMRDKAREVALLHYKELAPTLRPQHIQRYYKLEGVSDKYRFAGKPDLVEDTGLIHDIKTSKSKKKPGQLPMTQAVIYALLVEHGDNPQPVTGFQVDYLVWDVPKPFVDSRRFRITQKDIDFVLDDAERFAAARIAGVYPRIPPDYWKCSEKWCSQWANCRGRKYPPQDQ
jgi:hypothetical protein